MIESLVQNQWLKGESGKPVAGAGSPSALPPAASGGANEPVKQDSSGGALSGLMAQVPYEDTPTKPAQSESTQTDGAKSAEKGFSAFSDAMGDVPPFEEDEKPGSKQA